ncbi:hypothetical protein [Sorangium cellulosum]|nr:hypothetical protein [Sorangium cellulosum]
MIRRTHVSARREPLSPEEELLVREPPRDPGNIARLLPYALGLEQPVAARAAR